jgi:hypothetical protein
MKFIYVFLFFWVTAFTAQAQFLADNRSLNKQSVERWMTSAQAMSPVVELIDSMFATDEELTHFDELSPAEQDKKITNFLLEKKQLNQVMQLSSHYGWKSPGEFRRLGARLGNAIAAYFVKKDSEGLNEEQIRQLHEKIDAVILAVPAADIEFVENNEQQLQHFIRAYGK